MLGIANLPCFIRAPLLLAPKAQKTHRPPLFCSYIERSCAEGFGPPLFALVPPKLAKLWVGYISEMGLRITMSVYKNTQGDDKTMNEIVMEGVNWCEITSVTTIRSQLDDIQFRLDNPHEFYMISVQEKITELKEIMNEIFVGYETKIDHDSFIKSVTVNLK